MPITLLDIAKANGVDQLIDECQVATPEVRIGAARTIRGINYKTLVRTALGNSGGSFRDANEGVTPHVHVYENRLFETFLLTPMWRCDRAVAKEYEDGEDAYVAQEAVATLQGEFQGLGKQFYYGRSATGYGTNAVGNAKGFPGLFDCYDATNMLVDATGSSAGTASSVWLVRFSPADVQWVWGLNGMLEFSDRRIETVVDPNSATRFFEAITQSMTARPGLQVGSLKSVCRIRNLTAEAGHVLTDAILSSALAKFENYPGPNAIFMSLRSLAQLQASRTSFNTTGAPAPFPEEIRGIVGESIPIYVTGSISNTETIGV
jgi:hypothetical protein